MNQDFRDLLASLSAAQAEFLVVGAYALAVHGLVRATGDLDVWVRPSLENAERVWQALQQFGAPLENLTVSDLSTQDIVFRMGVPPSQIDILTSITGVDFDSAWEGRIEHAVQGVVVPVLSVRHQIDNKLATGRPKDNVDADWLKKYRVERRDD